MHISAKVCLTLGVVAGILGAVAMAFGFDTWDDIEEFHHEEISSGVLEVYDDDDVGDAGFTIYVEGTYGDGDGNGKHDVCDDVNITASHSGNWMDGFTTEWENEKAANTSVERFYFEVGGPFSFCNAESVGKETTYEGKNLVKIGRACWGCMAGNMTINSTGNNSAMWISYDDITMGEEFWGFVQAAGGFCCFCCAGLLILIGIILAVTKKEDQTLMNPYATTDANSPLGGEESAANDIHHREF